MTRRRSWSAGGPGSPDPAALGLGLKPYRCQRRQRQIAYRAGVSAQLVFGATVLATLLGVGLGVYTAMRQYQVPDRILQAVSIFLINLPVAVIGLAVVLIGITINQKTGHSVVLVSGAQHRRRGLLADDRRPRQTPHPPNDHLVLAQYAELHFLQRSLLLDTVDADFVRAARAKGLTTARRCANMRCAHAIIPVAVGVAFAIPAIFTGAVIAETIFGWEGWAVTSSRRSAPTTSIRAVAVAAFGALATAIGAILADVAVVLLDPRVRNSR